MRALTLLMAIVAALVLPVPAAGAATPAGAAGDPVFCWSSPSPGSGWLITDHRFRTCARCDAAGKAGVESGDWETYLCGFVPIGLDGGYYIFVRATT